MGSIKGCSWKWVTTFAGSRTTEHTVDSADVTKSLLPNSYHQFSVKKGIVYSGHTGDNSWPYVPVWFYKCPASIQSLRACYNLPITKNPSPGSQTESLFWLCLHSWARCLLTFQPSLLEKQIACLVSLLRVHRHSKNWINWSFGITEIGLQLLPAARGRLEQPNSPGHEHLCVGTAGGAVLRDWDSCRRSEIFLLSEHLYHIKKNKTAKQNRLYITALALDQIRCWLN